MDFKEHLLKYLTSKEADELISSFSEKEHKGLILNPSKMSDETFISLFPHVKKHPFVEHAYLYDKDEYDFGKLIYHDLGCYYIQDPSASLVSYFLNPKENEYVLDMCAAPGGKCVQASMLMSQKGLVYANDLSFKRAEILLSNVERMGLGNVAVLSSDLSKIKGLENSFDKVILDAPCSGSGMFRRSIEMKDDWTYEKVVKQSIIQKELITLAYSLLKPGGTLVYSTCSYSFEEDEEVVKYLLDNKDAFLLDMPKSKMFYVSKENIGIHLFPHLFIGEGHYICLIKKPGQLALNKVNPYTFKVSGNSKGNQKVTFSMSLPMEPIKKLHEIAFRKGLLISEETKDKIIYSYHYSHFVDASNSYELSDEELKKYLHGETLNILDNKKYSFVSYKGINVGPTNTVNRILKNLYPKGLRR